MSYKKCPICGLNYIPDIEEMCDLCKADKGVSKPQPTAINNPYRKNGRAIFYVFQNQTYYEEFLKKIIIAPKQDKGGNVPHHWKRLENVKKGDIILHGVGGKIVAISEAQGKGFDSYIDGKEALAINCDYNVINYPIVTDKFRKEKITYCLNKQFQPFNKNGDGNQGYLFDIDWNLAIIFIKEIIKQNPILNNKLFLKDIFQ